MSRIHTIALALLLSAASGLQAAPTRDLQLDELWRRGGESDELILGVIAQMIESGNGEIYLLDSQLHEIQVLDRDGEWLRTMGRRGEGPGEFQTPGDLLLGPGGLLGIVQVFPGKIVQITTDGDPAPNYPGSGLEGAGFNAINAARGLDDRIVVSGSLGGNGNNLEYLRSFGTDGEMIAEFHSEETSFVFGGMEYEEKTHRNFSQRWAVAADGRVACALEFDPYRIHVWNPDGTLSKLIERNVELVPRTREERSLLQSSYEAFTSWNPNSSYRVSDTHETIAKLEFREDGSLWVLPADGMWRRPEGCLAEFDVFDEQGDYVERVRLMAPGDPTRDGIFFSDDRVYVVTDLLGASMGAIGRSESSEDDLGEAAPMQIIAYGVTER